MAFQRQNEFAPFSKLYEGYSRLFRDGDASAIPFDFETQLAVVARRVFDSADAIDSELRDRGIQMRADARLGLVTIALAWAVEPRLARGETDLDNLAADVVDTMRLVIGRTPPEDGVVTLRALTMATAIGWDDLKDRIWR